MRLSVMDLPASYGMNKPAQFERLWEVSFTGREMGHTRKQPVQVISRHVTAKSEKEAAHALFGKAATPRFKKEALNGTSFCTFKHICNKCKSGTGCPALHTCPFQEEINDDSTALCDCCDNCVGECCDSI